MMSSPHMAALIDSALRDQESFKNILGCQHLSRHIAAQEISRAAMMAHIDTLKRQRAVMSAAHKAGIDNANDRRAVEEGIDTLNAEVAAYRKAIESPGYLEALAYRQDQYEDIIRRCKALGETEDNDGMLNSVARQSVDIATHMSNIGSLLCKLSVEIEARGASDIQEIQNIVGEVKSMRRVIRDGWANLFNDIEQLDNEGWSV